MAIVIIITIKNGRKTNPERNIAENRYSLEINPAVTGKPAKPRIQIEKHNVNIGFVCAKFLNSYNLFEKLELSSITIAENTPIFINMYATR